MKKIGIITINDYANYGNRLQNYAVHKIISNLGLECETIKNSPVIINNNLLSKIKKLGKKILRKESYEQIYSERIEVFKDFTNKYIPETQFTISPDNIPSDFNNYYDYFVVGSDQVWNPEFRFGSKIDFLTFADNQKKIAFSASFGVSSIPSEFVKQYSEWLAQFSHLSVREEQGKNIIRELSNRNAEVLLDPTMILPKENWEELILSESLTRQTNYILTYFLGPISSEVEEKINFIAQKTGRKIINLNNRSDVEYFSITPIEFINYIKNTDLFFTDSFHGVVFSIIFQKNFIVCGRINIGVSMNSRIETLLSKFQLENRKWETMKFEEIETFFSCFVNKNVSQVLQSEQKKASDYLKNAFKL
ncbi:polysaccharide pyruvyl transferase family protein [Streptococcus sp. P25B114]